MGDPVISVRLEPIKGADKYAGQKGHDLREGRIPGYVDRNKADLNSVLIPVPTFNETLTRIKEIKQKNGARQRFDPVRGRIAYMGIITFSKGAQSIVHALDPEEQNKRIYQTAEQVAKEHGTDLIGLSVHRDETALHAHFHLCGIGNNGKSVRIDQKACKKLQDVAARSWADLGIKRGKPKEQRKADGESPDKYIHRSVRRLHEDLPKEIEERQQELYALYAAINENILEMASVDFMLRENQKELELFLSDIEQKRKTCNQELTLLEKNIELKKNNLKNIQDQIDRERKKDYGTQLSVVTGFTDRLFEQFVFDMQKNHIEEAYRLTLKDNPELDPGEVAETIGLNLTTVGDILKEVQVHPLSNQPKQ